MTREVVRSSKVTDRKILSARRQFISSTKKKTSCDMWGCDNDEEFKFYQCTRCLKIVCNSCFEDACEKAPNNFCPFCRLVDFFV